MSPWSRVGTPAGDGSTFVGRTTVRPVVESAPLSLSLLRNFRLTCSAGEVSVVPAVQRLLGFLALQSYPLSRSAVAGSLWPETTQHRALSNLRRVLWRLPEPEDKVLVTEDRARLALASDIRVDVRRRRDVLHALENSETLSERDIEDLRGELLPDWSDEWIVFERERCRQEGLYGLDALAAVAISRGKLAVALRVALMAIELDPLRESSQRGVIRAHVAAGNLPDARRQYEVYIVLLREAGLEPVVSHQMRDLVRHLLPA